MYIFTHLDADDIAAFDRDGYLIKRGLFTTEEVALCKRVIATDPAIQGSRLKLADAAGVDRSNLATLVNELCDRGLVARTRHELDRRRYVLRLSTAGERLLLRTDGAVAAAEDELLSPLDETRRAQLYALLRQLADGVDLCPSGDGTACSD